MGSKRPVRGGRPGARACIPGAIALVLCAASAQAEPTAEERETARSLMDEADALRAAGELQRALERYEAADQLMRVPTTGLEVARTQAALGRLAEACATAIEVANSPILPREPPLFDRARALARAMVEDLRPRIPSLTVYVTPLGVPYELRVDRILVPERARALPYKLNPGAHAVVVHAPGYLPVSERVELAEAQRLELRVRLVATPPPPKLASAPRRDGAGRSGREARAIARIDATHAAGRMRGYVALGVGGAVLATGIATGVLAAVAAAEAKQRCDGRRCPASVEPDLDRANTIANVANVTLPLGVLAVGYGLYELLRHSGSTVEIVRSEQLQWAAMANGAGVEVRGAW